MPGRIAEGHESESERMNDVDHQDRNLQTELHYAAASNGTDIERVTQLVSQGANLELRDIDGATPLLLAAQYRDSEAIVRALLAAGADPAVLDIMNRPALMHAVWRGKSVPVASLLLHAGCDPYQVDDSGYSPVKAVMEFGRPDLKELFRARNLIG